MTSSPNDGKHVRSAVSRLITAYQRRFSESDYGGGIWKEIFNRYH
jgi:hypothetical protein